MELELNHTFYCKVPLTGCPPVVINLELFGREEITVMGSFSEIEPTLMQNDVIKVGHPTSIPVWLKNENGRKAQSFGKVPFLYMSFKSE